MRYIIEIDPSSVAGAKLLAYIAQINATENEIKVHKTSSLSDEDMALPGRKPRLEEIEEWLSQPDHEYISGNDSLNMLKKEMAEYKKRNK